MNRGTDQRILNVLVARYLGSLPKFKIAIPISLSVSVDAVSEMPAYCYILWCLFADFTANTAKVARAPMRAPKKGQ
jgi:hypothetical protein